METTTGTGTLAAPRDLEAIATALARVPFLAHLPGDQLRRLAAVGQSASQAAGPIFREGDSADRLYVVLEGAVRIDRRDQEGHKVALVTLGPGAFFGEIALIDGGPRSASAAAAEPCVFFTLNRDAFFGLLASSPQMLANVFSDLTTKVREYTERYFREELAAHQMRAEMEKQRHAALSQMVAGVAHEINTPLGIVNTAASLVARALDAEAFARATEADEEARYSLEDARDALQLLTKNVQRAHGLVQGFKNLSVSQVVDRRESLILPDVVAEIVDHFQVSARQARIEVAIVDRLDEGSHGWLGYRGFLSQILLNLLTNVQRYAYPDGAGGRVEIVLESDADRDIPAFVVTVRDFGAGIAPENLPRVFDAFFTNGRGRGGTGLGMSIVHDIVTQALHGRVSIDSAIGRGTAVRVKLPRVVPEHAPSEPPAAH